MDGYGYNGYGGGGGYDDYNGGGYGGGGYDQGYGGGGGGYGGGGYGGGSGGYGGGGYGGGGGRGGRGGGRGGGGGGGRGGGRGGGGGGGGNRRQTNPDYWKDPESEPFRKLFIGGLSYDTTEDSLKEHFGVWGEIIDVVVMRDPTTKRSRGFGFITYKAAQSIEEAQRNRPHHIDGRDVESKRAMPRTNDGQQESSNPTKKMFVGGVKDGDTQDDINALFSQEGNIKEISMVTDKNTGKLKPFCFVTFEDEDTTDKCVLKHQFDLNNHSLQVKKAEEKKQMQGGMGRGGMSGRGGYGGGYDMGMGGGYGDGSGGGAMRGGGYTQRGNTPYGQGYGRGGGGGRY